MQLLRLAYKFLLYRLKSFRLHGVHSPFVFDLYQNVILHDGFFQFFAEIEATRQRLLKSEVSIEITDYGAGSKGAKLKSRKLKDIAHVSVKPAKYGQLLFRIINYYQPATILELGTSLGITTAYLATARQQSNIFTFEGCPNLAAQATQNLQQLKIKNIKIAVGNLDETLSPFIAQMPAVDFVYFDGNHRYEPTMRYFETCLEKHTENSIFVLDDIYWSEEMEKAWKEICRHPAVTLSIDLFQLGLIFFRQQQPKQHFTLWF